MQLKEIMAMLDIKAYENFDQASKAVLSFLQQRLGLSLWMVTRTDHQDWVVLSIEDSFYQIQAGSVFQWTDSFCSRMVQGIGPRIAPDVAKCEAYLQAPIGQQVPIQAYIGVPLVDKHGLLFGTLCAIDPQPQSQNIEAELPLVELYARLLMTILESDMQKVEAQRHAERSEQDALKDGLTALYNRRAWDNLLMKEELRCSQYGYSAAVVVVDLDRLKLVNDKQGHIAGDGLLKKTARCLQESVTEKDIVARIGGDEFVILLVDADEDSAKACTENLLHQLLAANINASVGYDMRHPSYGIIYAWNHADRKMYSHKMAKKRDELQQKPPEPDYFV